MRAFSPILGLETSPLVAPYTGAVAASLVSLTGQYISARQFGALGDGSDQTAALTAAGAAAAAAGKILYLPAGNYMVSDPDGDGNCLAWPGVSVRGVSSAPLSIQPPPLPLRRSSSARQSRQAAATT